MAINTSKTFCYRITHRDNLDHLLENGLIYKHHPKAFKEFVPIGNPEIIDVRSMTAVRIEGFRNIGEYVPFYFTPRSIMLLNIISGYYSPKVPRRTKEEIIVIRCLINTLAQRPTWFFTDGQANDEETLHYNDLNYLDQVDWESIQQSNFKKTGDPDRQRRYQAEFLVYREVPIECIESICVYTEQMKKWVGQKIKNAGLTIPVHINEHYFFD